MLRFAIGLALIWGLMVGALAVVPRPERGCKPFCWLGLEIGTAEVQAAEFLRQQGLGSAYEWQTAEGGRVILSMGQGRLMRLEASWESAPRPPQFGELMLVLGAPTRVRLDARNVSNFRSLTVFAVYEDETQITFVTVRRLSNDPRSFGEFRLRPHDELVTLTRYSRRTRMELTQLHTWRGFARYPLVDICCR